MFQQGDPQRRPFLGTGGRPQLVDQHQRPLIGFGRHRPQVQDVRREGREVLHQRLFVADVGQYVLEDRQLGFLGRHRDARLRRQCRQPQRLQRRRLPACVRPADHQHRVLGRQPQRDGHHLAVLRRLARLPSGARRAQAGCLEKRMTRSREREPVVAAQPGPRAAEVARVARPGEQAVQLAQPFRSFFQRRSAPRQSFGQVAQDAANLSRFLFPQAHHLVVQVDGFERLQKNRLPGAAGGVNDPLGADARVRADGHHQPAAAQGDVVLLQGAARGSLLADALQRPVELLLLALDFCPQLGQLRRRVVVQLPPGQDPPPDVPLQRSEIGQLCGDLPQPRQHLPVARRAQLLPGERRSRKQPGQVQQLLGREDHVGDPQLLQQRLRVHHPAQAQLFALLEPGAGFGHSRQLALDPGPVRRRLQALQRPRPRRAGEPRPQQLLQLREFQPFKRSGIHAVFAEKPS